MNRIICLMALTIFTVSCGFDFSKDIEYAGEWKVVGVNGLLLDGTPNGDGDTTKGEGTFSFGKYFLMKVNYEKKYKALGSDVIRNESIDLKGVINYYEYENDAEGKARVLAYCKGYRSIKEQVVGENKFPSIYTFKYNGEEENYNKQDVKIKKLDDKKIEAEIFGLKFNLEKK